jgi:hypothetical protein
MMFAACRTLLSLEDKLEELRFRQRHNSSDSKQARPEISLLISAALNMVDLQVLSPPILGQQLFNTL